MTSEKLANIIRGRGYKLTPQRRAVLRVIARSRDHLTPGAIYERVRKEHPGIGLVTVYRMLELLADLNLTCRVHTEDGCRSYLMRRPSGHHHHIMCTSCGRVVDFTKCDLSELQQRVSEKSGFKIEGHLLQFNGLCQECREKTGAGGPFRTGKVW
ncbi:MAG: transcriptional repressor [Chloroflexi bacterium]|nr:transcriptional repressor [Chloroflexota bacterium]